MKHLNEQELVEYRYADAADRAEAARHLHECAECRAEYERLERVLAAVDALPVAEPAADYEERLWRALEPQIATRKRGFDWSGWREWLAPRRLVPIGAVALLVVAAFVAGRYLPRRNPEPNVAGNTPQAAPQQVRERILLVAVGDHLDRAQTVLLEISNAETDGTGKGARRGEVDISQEQQRAESLLAENRIYRQTAEHTGDNTVANVLDELEPVLMDIVHSPPEVSGAELAELQKRIESQGLLLKVRVLDSSVRDKTKTPAQQPPSQPGTRG
ncbi:MAG TPA: hypothetical protein VGZ48_00175 [Candidatus Acidoferrales bacterium]|jgi:hypothetical protein|nr:hypothetical protein [Candidatus Acidoferrales bacterium]